MSEMKVFLWLVPPEVRRVAKLLCLLYYTVGNSLTYQIQLPTSQCKFQWKIWSHINYIVVTLYSWSLRVLEATLFTEVWNQSLVLVEVYRHTEGILSLSSYTSSTVSNLVLRQKYPLQLKFQSGFWSEATLFTKIFSLQKSGTRTSCSGGEGVQAHKIIKTTDFRKCE